MSIKTNFEIPRAIDVNDIAKQGQRTAQDLSKNFKSIKKELDQIASQSASYVSGIDGIKLSGTFTYNIAAGTYGSATVVLTHGIGTLPSGFIITDIVSAASSASTDPQITRVSWTTTEITIRIGSINSSGAAAATRTGTFTIIVLR